MSADVNSFISNLIDPNEAIALMQEARERAAEVREAWTISVANGEQSFDDLMTLINRPDSKEGKYASKIKLYNILRLAKGWTDERAYQALVENGMDHKTTAGDARLYIPYYERFRSLISTHGEEWEPSLEREVIRPEMPAGWPWYSKLDGLMVLDGADSYPLPSTVKTGPSEGEETPSVAIQAQFNEAPTEDKGLPLTDAQRAFEEELLDDESDEELDDEPGQSSLVEDMKRLTVEGDDDADDEFDYNAAMRSLIDDDDEENDDPSDDLARMLGV